MRHLLTPVRGLQAPEVAVETMAGHQAEDHGALLLVCHAEPAWGNGKDPMLSCHGLEQAECLADSLADCQIGTIFTAPERRAQQTARLLSVAGVRPVHVLEALAKVGSRSELELPRKVRVRALQAVKAALPEASGRAIAVVTHASVITAILGGLLGLPEDAIVAPEHASMSELLRQDGRCRLRRLNDLSHLSRRRRN